jgi:hypothetical protein
MAAPANGMRPRVFLSITGIREFGAQTQDVVLKSASSTNSSVLVRSEQDKSNLENQRVNPFKSGATPKKDRSDRPNALRALIQNLSLMALKLCGSHNERCHEKNCVPVFQAK